MFTKPYIGEDDKLGRSSFKDFIVSLSESEMLPKVLVFWNNAVKTCLEGNELLPELNNIEKSGVKILVANHALEQLSVKTSLRVGKLANHFDLIVALSQVQKVVSF